MRIVRQVKTFFLQQLTFSLPYHLTHIEQTEGTLSYRLMTYGILKTNMLSAGATVMLCRANLSSIDLSQQDKADMLWKIDCQIAELNKMRNELVQLTRKKRG
ncbi:hypothetical protein [Paracoccus fontiphilus]|uniref:Uncharacterized protein n=1 Tax=Paracoccus fontiphilus TaxID=1815556 RepID=A0ABV7IM78_9RHOB|nr:hypothetical protein [Paracoccus fontiphilus]